VSSILNRVAKDLYFSPRWSPLAVRLYSFFRPPAYRSPTMEFDRELWSGICTFRSTDQRCIGENNAHPLLHVGRMPTDNRPCQFDGSRAGRLINATALKNIMNVWNDAMRLSVLQRQHFLKHMDWPEGRITLAQSYVLSKVSTARPAFLARRNAEPLASGQLDPVEAAFFSLGIGPAGVVTKLMETGDLAAIDDRPRSAAELYELADQSGSLISNKGIGCAGSRKLIESYLAFMINGTPLAAGDSPAGERVFGLIGDFDAFYRYVSATCRLELLLRVGKVLAGVTALRLSACQGLLSDDERRWATAHLSAFEQGPLKPPFSTERVDGYLAICRRLLADLSIDADLDALMGLCRPAILSELARATSHDLSKDTRRALRHAVHDALGQGVAALMRQCAIEHRTLIHALGRPPVALPSEAVFLRRIGWAHGPSLIDALRQ